MSAHLTLPFSLFTEFIEKRNEMEAVHASLELVETTFTHVFLFPYYVYCHGREMLREKKQKETDKDEARMEGVDKEEDGEEESLMERRGLLGKRK